uniref:Transmembrane serine protease 7 n=1 Tax=Buteo japonicus TaxID=224669 RepID=A0A8B9Z537_9AVES
CLETLMLLLTLWLSAGNNPISRIVGGTNTEEGEWPWQVSLHFVGAAYCGASVISKEWLTRLVCLLPTRLADPRAWRAHLGMQTQGRAKFVSAVRRIIVHEYYNSRNYDYDIALLQLSKPWPDTMSHVIQPICMPPFSHKVRSGDKCWITGWGQKQEAGEFYSSTILQKAEVEIIDQTLCHSTYGIITARMFCAGLMSGKRDGCKGDSGGPLSCQSNGGGKWFLTGIVSWGYGCGRPNFPGVYTRVSNFAPWIHKYVPSVL